MEFDPLCLINVFLAVLALFFYILGSYRLYKQERYFLLFIGIAIAVDIATAILASLGVTPTVRLEESVAVPWGSVLFKIHVIFSMIGFVGFILLFAYLAIKRSARDNAFVRKWQYLALLPVWIIGEGIALSNSILKITSGIRLFDII